MGEFHTADNGRETAGTGPVLMKLSLRNVQSLVRESALFNELLEEFLKLKIHCKIHCMV